MSFVSIPFLAQAKTVLIFNDEGLNIFAAGAVARHVEMIPWDTMDLEETVEQILVKQCKQKPVVILNDMVEQHYRKERIPKVSLLDRANVVNRKLQLAFPNYSVRAALKLKERAPQSTQGAAGQKVKNAGDIYLFAGISGSENLHKTLAAVRRSRSDIVGFFLLPVESSSLVDTLVNKLSKDSIAGAKSKWRILIGQHHGGGLRQIVTKNKELALTRITPVVEGTSQPSVWANEVANEFKSTMSYLSRFGYSENEEIDLVILAEDEVKARLSQVISENVNLYTVTPQEAAKKLGFKFLGADALRYADILHAAWNARKTSYTMPVKIPLIEEITKPRKIASLVMVLLIGALGYFGYQSFSIFQSISQDTNRLESSQRQLQNLTNDYNNEVAKREALGFNVALVQSSLSISKELREQKMLPLSLLSAVSGALGPNLRIDDLTIRRVEPAINQNFSSFQNAGEQDQDHKFRTVFKISFPSNINPEVGVREIEQLRDRLRSAFPEHEVNIKKQVADLVYTETFRGEVGQRQQRRDQRRDYEAELEIFGKRMM